jgi:hypothetical protein
MVSSLHKLQFLGKISKSPGGGYKIWIPKDVSEKIPPELWVFDVVYIRAEGFKQTLKNPPCSHATEIKKYIPIYSEFVETDYTKLGKVTVEMVYEI